MTDPNFVAQEGGDHYQSKYQHWDWVVDIGMTYLPATATKYLPRWRKKNGLEDLRKALTYIEKMQLRWDTIEDYTVEALVDLDERNDLFIESNGMNPLGAEARICVLLSDPSWDNIQSARQILVDYIAELHGSAG